MLTALLLGFGWEERTASARHCATSSVEGGHRVQTGELDGAVTVQIDQL
jgi:hypothetical protein